MQTVLASIHLFVCLFIYLFSCNVSIDWRSQIIMLSLNSLQLRTTINISFNVACLHLRRRNVVFFLLQIMQQLPDSPKTYA